MAVVAAGPSLRPRKVAGGGVAGGGAAGGGAAGGGVAGGKVAGGGVAGGGAAVVFRRDHTTGPVEAGMDVTKGSSGAGYGTASDGTALWIQLPPGGTVFSIR